MTFNPNIPTGGQTISSTTSPIQTNFSQSNISFAVDHTAFDVLTNQGMHKQVTLQAPIANPNQATPIATLYTKASPTTITSDLYYQNGTLASNVVQVTGGGISAAAWCRFDGTGGSPITPTQFYNVTNITHPSAGVYQVNFTRNTVGPNYCVQATATFSGVGGAWSYGITARAISSVTITTYRGTIATDNADVNITIFGRLA